MPPKGWGSGLDGGSGLGANRRHRGKGPRGALRRRRSRLGLWRWERRYRDEELHLCRRLVTEHIAASLAKGCATVQAMTLTEALEGFQTLGAGLVEHLGLAGGEGGGYSTGKSKSVSR
ncbi:hypothetical protein DFAR_2480050 [Desulfarculales bacterium]